MLAGVGDGHAHSGDGRGLSRVRPGCHQAADLVVIQKLLLLQRTIGGAYVGRVAGGFAVCDHLQQRLGAADIHILVLAHIFRWLQHHQLRLVVCRQLIPGVHQHQQLRHRLRRRLRGGNGCWLRCRSWCGCRGRLRRGFRREFRRCQRKERPAAVQPVHGQGAKYGEQYHRQQQADDHSVFVFQFHGMLSIRS